MLRPGGKAFLPLIVPSPFRKKRIGVLDPFRLPVFHRHSGKRTPNPLSGLGVLGDPIRRFEGYFPEPVATSRSLFPAHSWKPES